MPTVLIIDDNPSVGTALEVLLSLRGIDAVSATSPEEGLALLQRESFDLLIQDMNFSEETTSGDEGVALFHRVREQYPDLPVILLTAWTHLETAVDLVKAGAADYLSKPWDDDKLLATVVNLLELGEAGRQARQYGSERVQHRRSLSERFDMAGMVFAASATARVVELACQVARADVPVLITGPNGTGKERIAAIIQANSAVRDGPFVTVNCGALPSELVEAELFGADAGAYTSAQRAREGRFEAADGGTLFLDEIGNLPLPGQIKLLRVLETGCFERLGSSRTRQVKVRVISATNADLPAMIAAGQFRQDLYYRLNVIEIRMPPLAERRDDIPLLAEHFLAGRARLGDAARRALLAHDWPGNVRELKNAIERAVLLCGDSAIEPMHLALPTATTHSSHADEPDREAIEDALQRNGGVVAQAASDLGLSRQALYRRMDKLGLRD
ncbi:MAG: sigma-54 dependent transcriptional regulator [Lysobacterales bacterium]